MRTVKPKILAIDGQDENLKIIRTTVRELQLDAVETRFDEGLSTIGLAGDFAVIMIDSTNSDAKRLTAICEILQNTPLKNIPFIVITDDYKAVLKLDGGILPGYTDILCSPLHPQILKSKIDVLLQFQKQKRETLKIRKALDDSNSAVCITDTSGNSLSYINMEFGYLFEFTVNDLEDVSFTSLFLDPGQGRGILEDVRLNMQWQGEANMRSKSGKAFPAELRISIVEDDNFDSTGILLTCSNITARKESEMRLRLLTEELRNSNRELEQFAYVASHDLQEPLRVIISYLQFIESQFQNKLDTQGKHFIERTINAVTRLQDMIKSLLMYSKISTKADPFMECSLESILEDVLENLKSSSSEKNGLITHDALPKIIGDRAQIIRLFQNLIENALKFCKDKDPEIHISVKKEQKFWVFEVKDNGIGIEKEYYEKIFEIFQRLHSRAHFEGTGIGLAACKKIVERHNGKIWVKSKPGKGSSFYFTIGT